MTDLSRWTARPLPERRVLDGQYCRLEPLDPARHGEALFAASMAPGAEERHRYLFEGPMERAPFQAWLEGRAASSDPLFFAVIDKATGRAEGRQTFMRIDPVHGVIEIGSILWGPAMARSRLATEALFLFARHAFDDLGYRRFEWKCHNANLPSKRAALRFGFAYEGLFRQHMVAKGGNRDTAWFSMIDTEWPALRAGYEAWLTPANFLPDGSQIRDLRACLDDARGATLPQEFTAAGLRRAGMADLDRLIALQEACYAANRKAIGRTPIPLEWDYRQVLAEWECFVSEAGDRFETALIGALTPTHYMIESLSVHPDAQARGLGRGLLAAGEARARQYGRSQVRLLTNAKLQRNVDWYLAKGYGIERIERHADREILHFIKNLREA